MYRTSLKTIDNTVEEVLSSIELPENSEELIENILDGSRDIPYRRQCWDKLMSEFPERSREVFLTTCRTIEDSGSQDLAQFIVHIINSGKIDLITQSHACDVLRYIKHININDLYFGLLENMIKISRQERPPTTLFVDKLIFLMPRTDKLTKIESDRLFSLLEWFVCFNEDPLDYKHKVILNLQRDWGAEDSLKYVEFATVKFFWLTSQTSRGKILLAQWLLVKSSHEAEEAEIVRISREDNDPNVRADAADLLLRIGNTVSKAMAKIVLSELGQDMSSIKTTSSNSQNIHLFEESVNQYLLELSTEKFMEFFGRVITLDDIINELRGHSLYFKFHEKINSSILRIKMDQLLYAGNQTLVSIFLRIWGRICAHKDKAMLTGRLIEELVDMADTCSFGHAGRLVNVFSGVDGFIMKMKWSDQIRDNVAARLTILLKRARDVEGRDKLRKGWKAVWLNDKVEWVRPDMKSELTGKEQDASFQQIDEEFRNALLCELAAGPNGKGLVFQRFIRSVMNNIMVELKKEYVEAGHLTEDEFGTMFRNAFIFYETGSAF